jgi:hypothetical protein
MSPELADFLELARFYRWNVEAGVKNRGDINYGHMKLTLIEKMHLLSVKHSKLFSKQLHPEWQVSLLDTGERFGFQYMLEQDDVYRKVLYTRCVLTQCALTHCILAHCIVTRCVVCTVHF